MITVLLITGGFILFSLFSKNEKKTLSENASLSGTADTGKSLGIASKLFKILATNIVNEGDTLTIEANAAGKTYDIFFPDFKVYRKLSPGAWIGFEIIANKQGVFTYACRDFCPVGKKIVGTLTVKPKQ